jgi:hypothetical protein
VPDLVEVRIHRSEAMTKFQRHGKSPTTTRSRFSMHPHPAASIRPSRCCAVSSQSGFLEWPG